MDERECQSQAARIEALIQEVTAFPDQQMRARTEELLHALLEMYGTGLLRILEMTAQAENAGQALIETFAGDELVGSLLLLHGLHPARLEERISQAIEKLRPSVQKQGSTIEFSRVEDSVAYLRLSSSARGCASSMNALRQTVEGAIYGAAPDLDEIRFEGTGAPQQTAIPVKFVPRRKHAPTTPASAPAACSFRTR